MPDEKIDFIPRDITQAVAISNIKSVAEQPAMLANLAYSNLVASTNISQQNAISNQQAMNELGIAILGKVVTFVASNSGGEPAVAPNPPNDAE